MKKSAVSSRNKLINIRKAKKNFKIIVDFLGILMLWRGGWGLLDLYIFPNNQPMSYFITIAIGFILLMIDGDGLKDLGR